MYLEMSFFLCSLGKGLRAILNMEIDKDFTGAESPFFSLDKLCRRKS